MSERRDIAKSALNKEQRRLLAECGEDAQDHPLVIEDSGTLRFKADPVIRAAVDILDLNKLWLRLSPVSHDRAVRLALRRFYRNMGYSLGGYLEIFTDELDAEDHPL